MSSQEQKNALRGHQLVMTNISIFHLLLPIAAFSTPYLREILAISFAASVLFSVSILKGAKNTDCPAFVSAHWKKAWQRTQYLFISYVVSACVMGAGWLLTSTQTDPQMKKILLTTFIPMATVPTLATVIVVLVLQTMTISRARNSLMPNSKV